MGQYIYGKNVCKQILQGDRPIEKVFLQKGINELKQLVKDYAGPKEIVDKKVLDKLSKNARHQGIVVLVEDYKTYPLEKLLEKKGEYGLIVMLDGIEDPHNVGAILRTCDAIGVDGLIIKKHNACQLNGTVAKVSVGAIETIPTCVVTNLTATLKTLKEHDYWVVGTAMKKAVDYRQVDYKRNIVLIIGNEGKGISRLVLNECDYLVKLPMVGEISSLNASVAAGIMLYQAYQSRFPL